MSCGELWKEGAMSDGDSQVVKTEIKGTQQNDSEVVGTGQDRDTQEPDKFENWVFV